MDTITSGVTPLRQRMLEDMRIRELEARTQEAYSNSPMKAVLLKLDDVDSM